MAARYNWQEIQKSIPDKTDKTCLCLDKAAVRSDAAAELDRLTR